MAIKYVSVFNPVYFYQHLAVNHPHRSAEQLHHREEESMPVNVKYFAQAVRLQPYEWSNAQQILEHFKYEGHCEHYLQTIVAYVSLLHDILYLWQIRYVDGSITDINANLERLYPLSPHQRAVMQDVEQCLQSCRKSHDNSAPALTLVT